MSFELQDVGEYRRPDQPHYDLKLYQRSYGMSLEIYRKSSDFPKEERFAITDQIRRSSSSICANIAEGYGRQIGSDKDFRRFLIMARRIHGNIKDALGLNKNSIIL